MHPDIPPRVSAGAEDILERFGAVAGHDNLVEDVVFFESAQGQNLVVGVVFNQQDDLLMHGRFVPA